MTRPPLFLPIVLSLASPAISTAQPVGPRLFIGTNSQGVKAADLDGNVLGNALYVERQMSVEPYSGNIYSKHPLINNVYEVGVDGCIVDFPYSTNADLTDFYVDPFLRDLYTIESPPFQTGKVVRIPLDGGPKQTLVGTAADGIQPSRLAVDIDAGRLYVSDRSQNIIVSANLDGSNLQTVVTGVDADSMESAMGQLFFIDETGANERVRWVDVAAPATVHTVFTTSKILYDLEIDPVGGLVYWVTLHDTVYRSYCDGSSVTAIYTGGSPEEVEVYHLPCDRAYAGNYGFGKAGTLGEPALSASPAGYGNPVAMQLGNSAGVASIGLLAIGFSRTCTDGFLGTMLQVQPDVLVTLPVPQAGLFLNAQTPPITTLCDLPIYMHWFVADSGAPPVGVASSRPLRMVLGS